MPPEFPSPTNELIPTPPKEPPTRAKFRVRFCKAGDLRFVSHHDLMHIFERTFRRANLSVPTSQGFNPRPRMWFALSLALGIAGLNEVLELELSEPLTPEEVESRLVRHAPPGIKIHSVRAIDAKTSARVSRAWYRVSAPESPGTAVPGLSIDAFLSESAHWIERTRPHPRRINVRPYVSELHLEDNGLRLALWISSHGSARPEEIVAALGLSNWLENGAVLERTDLTLIDELPPDAPKSMPAMEINLEETRSDDKELPQEAVASGRPTAIIEDPLAFDS